MPEMSPAHAPRAEFESARLLRQAFRLEPRQVVHPHAATECARLRIKQSGFLESLPLDRFPRDPGTAVFIGHEGEINANGFVRVLASRRRLPERLLFVTARVELVPTIPDIERVDLATLSDGILLVTLRYGFNDGPDIPRLLGGVEGLDLDTATTRYYVSAERVDRGSIRSMPAWQGWLFAIMSRACVSEAKYFRLPANCTTEMRPEDR